MSRTSTFSSRFWALGGRKGGEEYEPTFIIYVFSQPSVCSLSLTSISAQVRRRRYCWWGCWMCGALSLTEVWWQDSEFSSNFSYNLPFALGPLCKLSQFSLVKSSCQRAGTKTTQKQEGNAHDPHIRFLRPNIYPFPFFFSLDSDLASCVVRKLQVYSSLSRRWRAVNDIRPQWALIATNGRVW